MIKERIQAAVAVSVVLAPQAHLTTRMVQIPLMIANFVLQDVSTHKRGLPFVVLVLPVDIALWDRLLCSRALLAASALKVQARRVLARCLNINQTRINPAANPAPLPLISNLAPLIVNHSK